LKFFVDEDTGGAIGRALDAVGVEADWVAPTRPIRPSTPDEIWLPRAGREGFLVLSRNIAILTTDAEVALLLAHNVGIVFLPQHISSLEMLRLILRRWEWLSWLYDNQARPFAREILASGRLKTHEL
jgi:PIN like domain